MAEWHVFRLDEIEFKTPQRGDQTRGIAPISYALEQMRGNIWRLPAGAKGRRHFEKVQEEIFVTLSGTASLALGDEPEMVEMPSGSVVTVPAGTPLQLLNRSDAEAVVLILGAPPVKGEAEYLGDILES
jgi:uncharacterized RmlC-like cupin family protein